MKKDYFLKKICSKRKSVLIFPSGSIYTSIEKRFSKSISKLSKANNMKVIAWKLNYEDKSKVNYSNEKSIFKYILNRFFSEEIELNIKQVKIFTPSDLLSEQKYHDKIRSFYLN